MAQNKNIKKRIEYIDIAKGLLICCLIYGHMLIFAREEGINDTVMPIMQKSIPLYNAFFMQTFFLITGLCSSFDKDLKTFLWVGGVKSLILPSAILVMMAALFNHHISVDYISWITFGGPWFVISLFWAKILYWFIVKMKIRAQLIVLGILYLTGIALNVSDVIPNYSFHRHTLLMLPYLFVGHWCRNHMDTVNRWLFPASMLGAMSILVQFVISQYVDFYHIPTHDFYISINKTFYIHIVNALSGSAFVLWLSRKINQNHILETLGKGTLLIYLWNGLINRAVLNIIPHFNNPDNVIMCVCFHTTIYIVILGVFYLLIRVIYGTKYLSWIVGKW